MRIYYIASTGVNVLKSDNDLRPRELAAYMIERQCTVRAAAKAFGISKSTVHKDITARLARLDPALFREVGELLAHNKSERHIRGGNATRLKYKYQVAQNRNRK